MQYSHGLNSKASGVIGYYFLVALHGVDSDKRVSYMVVGIHEGSRRYCSNSGTCIPTGPDERSRSRRHCSNRGTCMPTGLGSSSCRIESSGCDILKTRLDNICRAQEMPMRARISDGSDLNQNLVRICAVRTKNKFGWAGQVWYGLVWCLVWLGQVNLILC